MFDVRSVIHISPDFVVVFFPSSEPFSLFRHLGSIELDSEPILADQNWLIYYYRCCRRLRRGRGRLYALYSERELLWWLVRVIRTHASWTSQSSAPERFTFPNLYICTYKWKINLNFSARAHAPAIVSNGRYKKPFRFGWNKKINENVCIIIFWDL